MAQLLSNVPEDIKEMRSLSESLPMNHLKLRQKLSQDKLKVKHALRLWQWWDVKVSQYETEEQASVTETGTIGSL